MKTGPGSPSISAATRAGGLAIGCWTSAGDAVPRDAHIRCTPDALRIPDPASGSQRADVDLSWARSARIRRFIAVQHVAPDRTGWGAADERPWGLDAVGAAQAGPPKPMQPISNIF